MPTGADIKTELQQRVLMARFLRQEHARASRTSPGLATTIQMHLREIEAVVDVLEQRLRTYERAVIAQRERRMNRSPL